MGQEPVSIFGRMADGTPVERVVLCGEDGFRVSVISYGAAVQSILAPDRDGHLADIVLGHDTLAGYMASRDYFGATIGRYANRIAGGAFSLGGRRFRVEPNDGPNALHGGAGGFDTRLFEVESREPCRVVLRRTSPAGEEGFPGRLDIRVAYEVQRCALLIELSAAGDADTLVNLANHSYFNLAGEASGTALDHALFIAADAFLPVDAVAIPTGERRPVAGSPFDFRTARRVGERIRHADEQLALARGYDHNFCLRGGRTAEPRLVARLSDQASGRVLEVETDEAGLQLYSGNALTGAVRGKGGRLHRQGDAVCLEAQAFPDAPNRPDFPSTHLAAGETYRHRIRYRFSTAPLP
ncbi:aldose epimerase family protein [Aureimonas populi]|uniref:Aldose 1-epimerase n=1 Tax=Aureimonas populi TaxID=1701758 RepID=A0ABW5CP06_9HYPH|nr:aldose epimerase family protein [Aureimonas populi]